MLIQSKRLKARKVRMCVGRDSCCYARDGRYYGHGTSNYDVECQTCGETRTYGAATAREALERASRRQAPFCECEEPAR